MAKAVTSSTGKPMMMDMLAVPEERILVVQDGEILDLGGKTLQFIYFPWVHWPETMLTWLPQEKILFSCDAFGGYGALQGAIFALPAHELNADRNRLTTGIHRNADRGLPCYIESSREYPELDRFNIPEHIDHIMITV